MSTIDRQAIIDTLSRLVTPGIKLTALADELGAHKQQYAALREVILDLVEDGTVQVLSGGAFALAPSGRPGDPAARPMPPVKPEPARSQKKPTPTSKPRPRPSTAPTVPLRPVPPPREIYDPETGEVRPVGAAPKASRDERIIGRITVHPAGY